MRLLGDLEQGRSCWELWSESLLFPCRRDIDDNSWTTSGDVREVGLEFSSSALTPDVEVAGSLVERRG